MRNRIAPGLLVAAACVGYAAQPVVPVAPCCRPPQAPVVVQSNHDIIWWNRSVHGVLRPMPPSLKWLQDQGNWYTPFRHPGMTGPYDLRGWHRPHPRAKDMP